MAAQEANATSALRIARRAIPEAGSTPDAWPAHWPDVLQRVHRARGAMTVRDALPKLDSMPHFTGLAGMPQAVTILAQAITQDQHIVVTADFDCDGATACAVAVRALRMLGAKHASFVVPDRAIHGYGLTPALVETLHALKPDVVLTVDHGIACFEGIRAARAAGWRVVVTDHHLAGNTLPAADAIVNPNQPGDGFASKHLAGVGVVFYLMLALRAHFEALPGASRTVDLTSLLDFVAIGTVADMVELDGLNRALVGAGLNRIRAGKTHAGIKALAAVAGRELNTLTPSDIGFAIAPRINAAGRLEDMRLGIECLLADDAALADRYASVLDGINRARREIQEEMVDTADVLGDTALLSGDSCVCLFKPEWHAGVVGLVASKVKDRLNRPVFAFAPSGNDDGLLRGSARSITDFHVRDALARVDAMHPGLIERFGGHAMAAGLTLKETAFDAFKDAIQAVGRDWITPAQLQAIIETDGALTAQEMSAATAFALRDGGMWGKGYPEPVFDGVFEVVSTRWLKEKHLKLIVRKDGREFNAIQFNAPPMPAGRDVRLVYSLTLDTYCGGDAIQLMVQHVLPA